MYRAILVPLDGSRFAEFALPPAIRLSRETGARLHLVTVEESLPTTAPSGSQDAAGEWFRSYLEEMAETVGKQSGGEVTTSYRSGHVTEDLLDEARGVDLTVMASHGRGRLSRAWLGSVADSFVRQVDRPVLLVRPALDEAVVPASEWHISRILLPLDGTRLSEAIIDHAAELGSLFGASYHLVRVVSLPWEEGSTPYPAGLVQMNRELASNFEQTAREYLDARAERLRDRGLLVDTAVVMGGQPVHGILAEAESSGSDFIAISAHNRQGLSRAFLGSTADKVLRGAHIPVLMYRHKSAGNGQSS